MDFINDPIDQGAPEFNVTGIASIERISVGQVRVTKYASRKGENLITHHEIWDIQVWQNWLEPYEQAMRIIARVQPDGPNADRTRERH
jgi:hypothetical protein